MALNVDNTLIWIKIIGLFFLLFLFLLLPCEFELISKKFIFLIKQGRLKVILQLTSILLLHLTFSYHTGLLEVSYTTQANMYLWGLEPVTPSTKNAHLLDKYVFCILMSFRYAFKCYLTERQFLISLSKEHLLILNSIS